MRPFEVNIAFLNRQTDIFRLSVNVEATLSDAMQKGDGGVGLLGN